MKTGEEFMSIALDLAARGKGLVEPNPMVGALIVRDGREIARGWHKRFGGPHAEIEALNAAEADVRGADMYVTLEPCCHHGKTPPCTQAIIAAGIKRVIVAAEDVDAQVAGHGFEQLRRAGIEVQVGVLADRARRLLAPYIKTRTMRLPWVICKWAQTADGFLSYGAGGDRWVSCEQSREVVQSIRAFCDGILVGVNTALADDPMLTNRSGGGREPARVVLDARLRIDCGSKLLRTAGQYKTILAVSQQGVKDNSQKARELEQTGAELLILPSQHGRVDLPSLLAELGRRQWTHLLVEGGAQVHRSFIRQRLADELVVFVSPEAAQSAGEDMPRLDIAELAGQMSLRCDEKRPVGRDEMLRFILGERDSHQEMTVPWQPV